MKLSEMKKLIAAHELRLTKSLGQNFLHDRNQLLKIVELAELVKGDWVLEIGPGLGPLTELLLERAGKVLAIEKDARLVRLLHERFHAAEGGVQPSLQLVCDDALEFICREQRDWSQWKLVSNLPYSVASPILVELAQGSQGPSLMVATLQLEVVRRLAARPGSSDYGVLTLLIQVDYEPRDWFKIPPGCFFPEPDVDSACVCLTRRSRPPLHPELRDAFVRIVKRSFSQRRKMIAKLLKSDWPTSDVPAALARVEADPQARAETLDLRQFVRLAEILAADSRLKS
jgi:16S rRNA (adenine1518-N6/adenine1519-N6)-dimethyltransferase